MDYSSLFRKINDYPIPGIVFEDVTTFWKDGAAFADSITKITEYFKDKGITKVIGLEARGFVIAAPVAFALGVGFIPVRKPRKLPAPTISEAYSLEYGENILEMHIDAITPADKVLICDDILATGGTLNATEKLIQRLGGTVEGIGLLSELVFLNGRQKLTTKDIFVLYQVQE
ncbi:MAG: adenine phosphoribosyltransferase [Brevinema sp.]